MAPSAGSMRGRHFRMLQPYQTNAYASPVNLAQGACGLVLDEDVASGMYMGVVPATGTNAWLWVAFPKNLAEVAPEFDKITAHVLRTRALRLDQTEAAKDLRGIQKPLFLFARALHADRKNLIGVSAERAALVSSTKEQRTLATHVSRGIPSDLADMMMGGEYTIDMVFAKCEAVGKRHNDGGVYVCKYWDFPKDSPWYGWIVIYVGQTMYFFKRNTQHDKKIKAAKANPDEHTQFHYRVAALANKKLVCKIYKAQKTDTPAHIDFVEQWFVVAFRAYAGQSNTRPTLGPGVSSIQTYSAPVTDDKNISRAIGQSKKVQRKLMAVNLMACAAAAFPGSGLRAPSDPKITGVNDASPWTPGYFEPFDKPSRPFWNTYTMEEGSDRYYFYGPPRVMAKKGDALHVYWNTPGDTSQFNLNLQKDGPQQGDLYYVTWELMKKGPHPIPFLRQKTVSPFSNNADIRKIGCNVTWKSVTKDVKGEQPWMSKYHQFTENISAQMITNAHKGSTKSWGVGTAIFERLVGMQYPNRPDWIPEIPKWNIIRVEHNLTTGQARVSLQNDLDPLIRLQPIGEDYDWPAKQMRDLSVTQNGRNVKVLKNVDAPFGTLDHSWTNNHRAFIGPDKPPKTKQKYHRKRHHCDGCFLWNMTSYSTNPWPCERQPGTNRCKRCVAHGIPCSWTPAHELGGPNMFTHKAGTDGSDGKPPFDLSGPVFEAAYGALLALPLSPQASVITRLDNDGMGDFRDELLKNMPFKVDGLAQVEEEWDEEDEEK